MKKNMFVYFAVFCGAAGLWLYMHHLETLLTADTQALEARLNRIAERAPFVVVDTIHNRLTVRQGRTVLREAICSTGSGEQLVAGRRAWVFQTPHGLFRVKSKVADPVWIKPNWAFVEEGQPVPTAFMDIARFDSTSLGEYALELGDGYLIHGTLYINQLGIAVTHGCIRLDDDDLKLVYDVSRVRTAVYIY